MVNWGSMLQTGANNPLTTGYQSPLPEEEQLRKIKEMMMNRQQPMSVLSQMPPGPELAMPDKTNIIQRLLAKVLGGAENVAGGIQNVAGNVASQDWGKIAPQVALAGLAMGTPGIAQGMNDVRANRQAQAALAAEAEMKRKQELINILKEFNVADIPGAGSIKGQEIFGKEIFPTEAYLTRKPQPLTYPMIFGEAMGQPQGAMGQMPITTIPEMTIDVISPKGEEGTISLKNLKEALNKGYRLK